MHLDDPYVYAVPPRWQAAIAIGVRVRVPFGTRRRVTGYVVDLHAVPVDGLREVERVVSVVPAFDEAWLDLVRWVAEHTGASLAASIRTALPARVAGVEREAARAMEGPVLADRGGDVPLELSGALTPGAVTFWCPLATEPRGPVVAALAARMLEQGKGVVVVVPETAAASSVATALRGAREVAELSAALGDRNRYQGWRSLQLQKRGVAFGGRSAIFAPVPDLGLIVVDDEANSSHKEQRAPRYHARDVALERARRCGAAVLLTGFLASAEVVGARRAGVCAVASAPRSRQRSAAPLVEVVDPDDEGPRGPGLHPRALRVVRDALRREEPVFVLVPRRGAADPEHPGSRRTGQVQQELTRTLQASGGASVGGSVGAPVPVWRLDREIAAGQESPWSDARSGVIVGTVAGVKEQPPIPGCRTVVVVAADAALGHLEVRAAEEALRTWSRAAAWCGPRGSGGRMVLQARAGSHHAVQALVRWDPEWFWKMELPRREELQFPPARQLLLLEGPEPERAQAVIERVTALLGDGVELLGPMPMGRGWRLLIKVADAGAAAVLLRPLLAETSRRAGGRLAVDVRPLEALARPRWEEHDDGYAGHSGDTPASTRPRRTSVNPARNTGSDHGHVPGSGHEGQGA